MVVVFGSYQYKVINYGITDTELDVYIPKTEVKVDKNTLKNQVINQSEISLKNDDNSIFKTILNFTVLKDNKITELPSAVQEGNVDCYRITLTKNTTLAQDILTNKANIEYIAAMSDVEL